MGDKIQSHGQTGGITAKNVNIGENNTINSNSSVNKKPKNKLTKNIVLIIMLAAAVVTVLAYLNIKP